MALNLGDEQTLIKSPRQTQEERKIEIGSIKISDDIIHMDRVESTATLTDQDTWVDIDTITFADGDLRINVGTSGTYNFVRIKVQWDAKTGSTSANGETRTLLDGVAQDTYILPAAETTYTTFFSTFGIDPSAARTVKIQIRRTAGTSTSGNVDEVFITATIMETQS